MNKRDIWYLFLHYFKKKCTFRWAWDVKVDVRQIGHTVASLKSARRFIKINPPNTFVNELKSILDNDQILYWLLAEFCLQFDHQIWKRQSYLRQQESSVVSQNAKSKSIVVFPCCLWTHWCIIYREVLLDGDTCSCVSRTDWRFPPLGKQQCLRLPS